MWRKGDTNDGCNGEKREIIIDKKKIYDVKFKEIRRIDMIEKLTKTERDL